MSILSDDKGLVSLETFCYRPPKANYECTLFIVEQTVFRKCPGMYCGRTVDADGNSSECGVS